MVSSEADELQGSAVYVSRDGTPLDLGGLLVRDMHHWRDALVLEWVHTGDEGATDFHLALLMKHLGDGVTGSVPLSRVTAYVCQCSGVMLASSEQQAFVDCITVTDGRPWSGRMDCFPLDGTATFRRYEQDCLGDAKDSACAQRVELEFVGNGTSESEAIFGASFRLRREEELVEATCIE